MKKILFLSLVALAAACCGPKNEVNVDKLIANPAEFMGKEITFTGKAVVTEDNNIAVYGTDSTKYIMVKADSSIKVCGKMCGKTVKVVGNVVEAVIDVAVVDSTEASEIIVDKFFVAAKSIEVAACCKKDSIAACVKADSAVAVEADSAKVE